MYDRKIFNEIDEIDHFTKAIRGGTPLDRQKAAVLIKTNAAKYGFVGAVNARFTANGDDLSDLTDNELYDGLVAVRNAMSKNVGIKGF